MALDGEVVYEIRADDSLLNADLSRAEQKVEQSVKRTGQKVEQIEKETSKKVKKDQEGVTQHHEKENEKRKKSDENTGKQREENERKVSGEIKKIISDAVGQNPAVKAAAGLTEGLSGTAAAIVDVGAMAVSGASKMEEAMNGYLISTGKGQEETERYQQVLEKIYANNYGKSFEDIASAMAEVDRQMGDLDDESLQSAAESAFVLRDAFGYDIPESTKAAQALIKDFGVDSETAMGMIAKGAQDGLDASGSLLDNISEYSPAFAEMGLSADDMFKIFREGSEAGVSDLSVMGEAVAEMSTRVLDGSESTREGFELMGLNADEMAEKFAAGGESAKEAFEQTIEALAGLEDPMAQNSAGLALFGEAWGELGPNVISQLAGIGDEAYAAAENMEAIKDIQYDELGSVMESLQRSLELLLVPLGEALIPLLTMLAESVLPLITQVLGPIMELLTGLLTPVLALISTALQPLLTLLTELITGAMEPLAAELGILLSVFQEVMGGIRESVASNLDNVKTILGTVIDFVKNVFTLNWKGVWENVKTIFQAIVDSFLSICKAPVNAMIDVINGFINGLNNIRIPDWVPGIGGRGFSIPTIPRLKAGIDFVPGDFFPAYLDYGERVMTMEENARFNALGGLAGLEAALSRGNKSGEETRIVLAKGCIVVQANIEGRAAAKAIAPYMDTELGEAKGIGGRNQ